jgi:prepilin-type processing-associated H-X9-DG protein
MFMPRWPIGGARESARRTQCSNNLHNIALALQNYEAKYHCLPPAYSVDAEGKPLHSWRTLILPFIEQQNLYHRIDLTKAWDDPVNQHARDVPLRLYECPSSAAGRGTTTYFAVVAAGGCFKGAESKSLSDVKDRQGRTLMVIEVAEKYAVHWMSPTDATEDMILSREHDSELSHPGGSNAAFADGSIRHLTENALADEFKAMKSTARHDGDVPPDR